MEKKRNRDLGTEGEMGVGERRKYAQPTICGSAANAASSPAAIRVNSSPGVVGFRPADDLTDEWFEAPGVSGSVSLRDANPSLFGSSGASLLQDEREIER